MSDEEMNDGQPFALDDRRVIMEERVEVEAEGRLGGTEMAKESQGVVKTRRIPVCDYCGRKLDEKFQFAVCQKDRRKLCPRCSVTFRNRIICPDDLRSFLPLSRPGFKILLMMANGITDAGDIRKVTRIPKNDVKDIMRFFQQSGYTDRRGLLQVYVTELGMEALACYGQLYGEDADMRELDQELIGFVLRR